MKKIIILIILIISFAYINVNAATCDEVQCIRCIYKVGNYFATYDANADGLGGATVEKKYNIIDDTNRVRYTFKDPTKNAISASNFIIESKKLVCPSRLYLRYETGASTNVGVEVSFSRFSDSKANATLTTKTDNEKPFLLPKQNNTKGKTCSYNGTKTVGSGSIPITITRNNNSLNYELGNGYKVGISELSYGDFPLDQKGKCPTIYIKCGSDRDNKSCHFYKDAIKIYKEQGNEGNEGNDTKTGDDIKKEEEKFEKTPLKTDIPKLCEQAGVLSAFRFIGYLLVVVKIVIPIILIVMGSLDFGKAIMDSNQDAVKKATHMFATRIITGVVIFLLPTVVNFVFGLLPNNKNNFEKCSTCLFTPNKCNKKTSNSNKTPNKNTVEKN